MGTDRTLTHCGVIGGGPSGLVLALLLARRNCRVTVVEQGEGTDPRLANISPFLAPPSLQLLDELGLLDELLGLGQPIRQVVETLPGGPPFVLDYPRASANYGYDHGYALSVPLLELSRVLRNALAHEGNASVVDVDAVTGLTDLGDRVIVDLDRGGVASTVDAQFIVCNDGKFSPAREMAGIGAEVFEFDRPLVMMVLPKPTGWPESLSLRHVGDSLVAVMPVAGDILVVQWLGAPAEYGALRAGGVGELHAHVVPVLPELTELLVAEVTGWDKVLTVRHHVVRPETWWRGRIGLLGDSAHGVHSLGGQGLNMGLQDATVLGSLLPGAHVGSSPFAEYERFRRPFVEEFQHYQTGLLQLTTQPDGASDRVIYEAVSGVVIGGQPELRGRLPVAP